MVDASSLHVRLALSLFAGLFLTTIAATASAYGSGATGYSGKDGSSCNGCHSGGKAPAVQIDGPSSIAAGQTADFTFTVTTTQTRAGADIAGSEGVTLTPGTNLQDLGGELTHTKSTPVSGGKAVFKFTITAPASGSSLTLYAAGLAANGNGTGGDKATTTTKAIAITGATTTTPPAPTTPPTTTTPPASTDPDDAAEDDAAPTTAKDATEPTSAKKKTTKKASDDDDDDDDDDDSPRRIKSSAPEGTACSMRPGTVDPAGLSAATCLLFGLALLTRRRVSSPRPRPRHRHDASRGN